MKFLSRPEPEPEPEPTDPIRPCKVEKFECLNGDTFLLNHVKRSHTVNGTAFIGQLVFDDGKGGDREITQVVIPAERVKRHAAMGWRESTRSLHELPDIPPYSRTV